jgi:hypothetical protein
MLVSSMALLALLGATTAQAIAAPPDHEVRRWTQEEDMCGLTVTADRRREDSIRFRVDHDGFELVTSQFSGTTRWTYEPTGRWIENQFAGVFRDHDVDLSDDGILTITYGWTGTQLRLKSSDGGIVMRDIGRGLARDVWDLVDVDDPDDDVLVSSEFVHLAGPKIGPDDFDCDLVLGLLQ